MLALLLGSLLAACTRTGSSTGGLHSWTKQGVFRYAENADLHSLNPLLDGSTAAGDVSMFIYSYAVRYNSKAQPVPDALSEVPTVANGDVTKDGLTLTYKLRHNIRWQDGPRLTCKDVRFTWQYVMNPHTNVTTTDGFSSIKDITCNGPYVAIIHLIKPYAPFLQTIFGPNGNAPILPEHILAKYLDDKGSQNSAPYNAMPIGSGPFKVVSWERGTGVRMIANPNYFLGKPKLSEVDFSVAPDANTLITQVQTHAVDMLARGEPSDWPRYAALAEDAANGLRVIQVNSFLYTHIDFNTQDPILSDIQVRRALAHATNRSEILAKIFHGVVYPSDSPEHPILSWGYTNDTVHYAYDPAQARKMLDDDGWVVGPGGIRVKNGRRLEFNLSTITESQIYKSIEALVQREWHEVGVQANIKNYPTSQMYANGRDGILEGGHYDVAIYSWTGAADPDLDPVYSANDMAPRGQNIPLWNNAKATAALADALATMDQTKRKADYVVFQQELAKDVPTIILGFRKEPYLYNVDLKGFDPSPVISPFWDPWNYSM
jgi:peptide/nickel transport system substrate-binding protein